MKINVQRTEKMLQEQRQRDEFNLKWIDLLTGCKIDKMFEFEKIRLDAPSELLAIMKYRRILREEGRGQDIKLEDLKNNILNKEKLQELLQELFLEPFLPWWMDFFYREVEDKYKDLEIGIEKLYKKYEEDKGCKFLNRVLVM